MELFEHASRQMRREAAPLAERVRPRTLDEFVGQDHLLGEGRLLRAAIERGDLHSMILWGPPGTGKTIPSRAASARRSARIAARSSGERTSVWSRSNTQTSRIPVRV